MLSPFYKGSQYSHPFLFYTIIFLGIVVPAYFLIKNYKKDNYEE